MTAPDTRRGTPPMTRREEAAIWRAIGKRFENPATRPRHGICWELRAAGLPAYAARRARIRGCDFHGATWVAWWSDIGDRKDAAMHRALTCYLMAEMVQDGLAPGGATP